MIQHVWGLGLTFPLEKSGAAPTTVNYCVRKYALVGAPLRQDGDIFENYPAYLEYVYAYDRTIWIKYILDTYDVPPEISGIMMYDLAAIAQIEIIAEYKNELRAEINKYLIRDYTIHIYNLPDDAFTCMQQLISQSICKSARYSIGYNGILPYFQDDCCGYDIDNSAAY